MVNYKVNVNISWNFDSTPLLDEAILRAQQLLSEVVEHAPTGDNYENYHIQLDLVPTSRNKLTHLKEFDFDDFIPHLTPTSTKKKYEVDGIEYSVKMKNAYRYSLFRPGAKCVSCGIESKKLILDVYDKKDSFAHFNLYAIEDERLLLMTVDHIIPRAKGGKDTPENYQLMCSICNCIKSDCHLLPEEVLILRDLKKNNEKLSKRKLSKLIFDKREELIKNRQK